VILAKVLVVPNEHCDYIGFLTETTKSVVVSLAKKFHDNLDVHDNCSSSEFDSSLSSKCHYLESSG